MATIQEGVLEELPSGMFDAAIQTDRGPMVLRGAERTDRPSMDPQLISACTRESEDFYGGSGELTSDQLLRQLDEAGPDAPSSLLCTIELARFVPSQRQVLLPLLWEHILNHRDSNDQDELVGVAAAIRKYIAIMPMVEMGHLVTLLETGHRSPLPVELEIEVAKMIYRNFEVNPPVDEDPQPELAQRLWEMVQAYINPRVLLRNKISAVTSLAIEAIIAMRSPLAEQVWRAAIACPYRWFADLVNDDLDELQGKWESKHPDAAAWLRELRTNVLVHV